MMTYYLNSPLPCCLPTAEVRQTDKLGSCAEEHSSTVVYCVVVLNSCKGQYKMKYMRLFIMYIFAAILCQEVGRGLGLNSQYPKQGKTVQH